jgi:hypothetical protein
MSPKASRRSLHRVRSRRVDPIMENDIEHSRHLFVCSGGKSFI